MALRACFSSTPSTLQLRCSAGGKFEPPAAQQFGPLAAIFRRRLLTGIGTATLVALGANFGGLTSFLLNFSPELGRTLKLDVLYPVQGFIRYLDTTYGFEFIYPESWVGDRTVLYRAIDKAESERSLDPPPLNNARTSSRHNVNEPVAAFGPPGSNGELNVSVIVSPVPNDFTIEAFGGPKDVGETVVKRIAGSRTKSDVTATLIDASLREDSLTKINYYKLEFRVEGTTFQRHNVAVCCARNGKLYTLNAQAPESVWPMVRKDLYKIADSFSLTD